MRQPREKKTEGEKIVSVWFPESVLERLDRLAAKGDIARSRLIRNLTGIGVDYLETCEKFGIFQTAVVMRDFQAWFKERCESGVGGDVEKA